jgi:hypothetical protein
MSDINSHTLAPPNVDSPSKMEQTRFSYRKTVLLVAVVASLFVVGRAAVKLVILARNAAISNSHRNDLRWVYLGIRNYESSNGFLPNEDLTDPRGNVLSSWRFAIHPFVYTADIVRDFAAAWNAPSNRMFAELGYTLYCWDDNAPVDTSVFAVTGADTIFDGTSRESEDLPEDLVLLMEVRDSKTNWMQPGDYDVADLLKYEGRIGEHLHGVLDDRILILFADGEVWALDPNAPIADLQRFLTISGAKTHDRDQLLAPHRVY